MTERERLTHARTDIEYALSQLRRAQKAHADNCFMVSSDCAQRALDGLERAHECLYGETEAGSEPIESSRNAMEYAFVSLSQSDNPPPIVIKDVRERLQAALGLK